MKNSGILSGDLQIEPKHYFAQNIFQFLIPKKLAVWRLSVTKYSFSEPLWHISMKMSTLLGNIRDSAVTSKVSATI